MIVLRMIEGGRVRLVRRHDAGEELQSPIPTDEYVRQVKIACDDLHYDPLSPDARRVMLELLTQDLPLAW